MIDEYVDGRPMPEFFQRLDQRCLGVAGRRIRRVAVRGQLGGIHPLALGQLRQPTLGVVGLTTGLIVDGFHVGLEKAGESQGATAGTELDLPTV